MDLQPMIEGIMKVSSVTSLEPLLPRLADYPQEYEDISISKNICTMSF